MPSSNIKDLLLLYSDVAPQADTVMPIGAYTAAGTDDAEIEDELETARQLSTPRLGYKKVAKRLFINGLKKQALNHLIPELPPEDTDIYVIGNGAGAEVRGRVNPQAFDFGTFIPHLSKMLGDKGNTCYISTWSMNRYHARTLLELLDAGSITKLTVFTDPYFKRRESAICNYLMDGLITRGQRFLAFKNHVKAIAIKNPEGRTCVVQGSANLSAQPRCENYVLTTHPSMYEFYVSEFFEAMIK